MRYFATFVLIVLAVSGKAQNDYNPFASIGKKAKILTASNGEYEEFNYDTIQRIGSVLVNTKTHKIVKMLDANKTFAKASDNSAQSRWYGIDPLAYTMKNNSYSPYCFVADNPILLVDPDGKDWYKDNKGTMQFDPKVQSQKDLQKGQTYVGDTYQDKNKKGVVTADYRADGSIMYSKQKDAYNRMYNNSKANGNREESAVVSKNGVLVLPDYKNTDHEIKLDDYHYDNWKNGNLVDPVSGKTIDVLGTIHTHLTPNGDATPSDQDVYTAASKMPYKIFMTMGKDGNVYADYTDPKASGYYMMNKYMKNGSQLTNADLLNGYDLISVLESITIGK
jgi:hypothetical protein